MSTRQGFWARFSARLHRNARWWWTFWAAYEIPFAVLVANPWTRLVGAALAAWFAFWAGWHWRERTAHRRVMRLAETGEWQAAIRASYGRGDAA